MLMIFIKNKALIFLNLQRKESLQANKNLMFFCGISIQYLNYNTGQIIYIRIYIYVFF